MKKNLKTPFISKKSFKRRASKCQICGEKKYELLDTHRIIEGGQYIVTNCVCLCAQCHRKTTTGLIKVIGWKHSTVGNILHYIDENGEEKFI